MKTTRQRKGKTVEAPKKCNARVGCTGSKKPTNRTSGRHQKTTGRCDYFLTEEDPCISPFSAGQVLGQQLPSRITSSQGTAKEVPAVGLKTGQLHPSAKIKLQLFPIDEGTRIGLEKDGHNPFLELTLRARKKISSVLKHLNSKWGSSSVALGEPMLFPYNIRLEKLATFRRWTLNDSGISAGDVYTAIESPATFRLRYGWFSNLEPKNFGVPSTSTPLEACLKSEGLQKGFGTISENRYDRKKKLEVTSEQFKPINISKAADAVVTKQTSLDLPVDCVDDEVKIDNGLAQSIVPWDDSLTNLSIGGLLSEASLQGRINNCDPKLNGSGLGLQPTMDKGLTQSLAPWDDSLTTLSIGGLLSEASLQGKISNSDPKSNGSKSGLQPTLLISDSFDAFIAGQINSHPQASKPSSHDSRSSILDAEETCHAFPFQKFSSSGKEDVALRGSVNSHGCSYDGSSKSFKFPNFAELNGQAGLAQDPPCQESKTDLLPHSRGIYNDESSLGLTGIKWNDSLGPFDLGLSTSRQIANGDSISISEVVR